MKKQVLRYNRLVRHYNRYRRKLQRVEAGTSRYRRKDVLIKRLERLYQQIMDLRAAFRVATAGAAVAGAIALTPVAVNGQSYVMRTDVPTRHAHIDQHAKPAFGDVDGDGDMDLLIGGKTETTMGVLYSNVLYFENQDGIFQNMPSPFPDSLNINPALVDTAFVAPAFMDYDNDGDPDCFMGLRDSTIIYYENDGGTFTGKTGADNPFDGIKLAAGRCAPTFMDVDGDGDMDAVIGKEDGNLAYFVNENGTFVEKSGGENPFDPINVSENAAPAFADLDNDGDMDLFVGNKEGVIAYFENDGGVWTPNPDGNPLAGIRVDHEDASPAFADIDKDGMTDVWVGQSARGLLNYYKNTGDEDNFQWVPDNPVGMDRLEFDPNPGSVDYDNDGDMDVFVGMGDGFVEYFMNDGGTFVRQDSANNPLNTGVFKTSFFAAPTFADLDNDGDMDCYMGTTEEDIVFLRNDGGEFIRDDANNPFAEIDAGENECIAFTDYDNDGDLDAFIGIKDGAVRYYRNDGFDNMPIFVDNESNNPFRDVDFSNDVQPNFVTRITTGDMDGDGEDDAIVGQSNGIARYFTRDGQAWQEREDLNPLAGYDFGRGAAPDLVDVDGDGDMDMLMSQALGVTYYFENEGASSNVNPVLTQQTNLYPNPVRDQITLEIPWNKSEVLIELISLEGRTIYTQRTSETTMQFNVDRLPSGMYLVRITGDEGAAVKPLVKD